MEGYLMGVLEQYFKDVSKVLESQFRLSSNIQHRGLIGQNREIFIKDFLEKAFPKKFVIGQGEILDSAGSLSRQADVVVYDEFMPTFDYGASQHFLSGGVLAHIEVKSNLTSDVLVNALDITKSIKNLRRDIDATMYFGDLPRKIGSFLFAYDGVGEEAFKQKFQEYYQNESDTDNVVDAVCVLNKYVMLKRNNGTQVRQVFLKTGNDSLLFFFSELFEVMQKTWAGKPDFNKYLEELNPEQF